MSTMKAVYFEKHGENDVLQYGERPIPTMGVGDVTVRVKAAALNHLDVWVRRGLPGIPIPLPHIGGSDVVGVVEKVGDDVVEWKVGDEVLVDPSMNPVEDEFTRRGERTLSPSYKILGEHLDGGLSEYVVVPSGNLLQKPTSLSWEEAAACPLVFQTAWRAVVSRGRLRPGEWMLVHGATGGVASIVVQIGNMMGARVIATVSTQEKADLARELGAHHIINYREEDFSRAVRRITGKRGVDLVIENVGADTWMGSLRSCCKGGRIVTYGATTGAMPQTQLQIIFFNQLEIIGSTMGTRQDLVDALQMVEEGRIRPIISRVLPLSQAAEGYALLEERKVLGKVVIRME